MKVSLMNELNIDLQNSKSDACITPDQCSFIEPYSLLKVTSQKPRLLLMDDDDIICFVVVSLLTKAGFEVVCAKNSNEALKLYIAESATKPFSIVMMDLTIPGEIGGRETVKILRKFDPNAKVIAFSGYSHDPIMSDFAQHGFDGVLCKPFTNKDIINLITLQLGNSFKA